MKNTLDQFLISKAMRYLESSDEVLSTLIRRHGTCTLTPALANPFHALTSSIISQQLSARAARAIKRRLLDSLKAEEFTAESILNMSEKAFRSTGLSKAKQAYIRALAVATRNGDLDLASLAQCEDEDVITKLSALSGVGRWTAEMFLIFGLGRPDILSVNDAGLKRGFKDLRSCITSKRFLRHP